MSRVVIWPGCGPLLLMNVIRLSNGVIKSGYVVNGGWNFEIRNNECLAKDGNKIVNRWPFPNYARFIEIPGDMKGDYNKIIAWAEQAAIAAPQTFKVDK